MSAIFGLINLNGEQVPQVTLERMNAALVPHGSDGGGTWTQGPVGLGQRLMCFTPEDRFEQQPLVSADGQRVLVSDACLDNRAELIADNGFGFDQSKISNGELILRAHEKWGADGVQHLVGAYAFALWDAREQRLLFARSAISGPALFYHATPQTFAFATMPKGYRLKNSR
jgi:asparagine synthase (glutamine-hydrolysing)